MKRIAFILLISLLFKAQGWQSLGSPPNPTIQSLYQSLTPDQLKIASLPFTDPARHQEQFTPGPRAGIQLKNLTPAQHTQALALLDSFTSEAGSKQARQIASQGTDSLDQYYLVFFGNPAADKQYAWRIAEHHLTLVDLEFTNGDLTEFGPILLGANPPTLFNTEEDLLIDLYKSLTPAERAKASRQGHGDSSKPIADAGIPFPELSDTAQQKVRAMLDQRLSFYSPEIRPRIESIIHKQGGLPTMRLAFWGAADKRCSDGGKWDFKLGSDHFLCDYENTRGHIHMSMKGSK